MKIAMCHVFTFPANCLEWDSQRQLLAVYFDQAICIPPVSKLPCYHVSMSSSCQLVNANVSTDIPSIGVEFQLNFAVRWSGL